jgi:transcriptional regulator with XRE-family HTH domain
MDIKNIGKALRKLRTDKGVGLRQLSRKAGMSPASISAIEKGSSSPTLATLDKILKELGSDLAEFFANSRKTVESPVFTSADMQSISDRNRTYRYLVPKSYDKKVILIDETIDPAEKESEWEVHNCDLAGTILSGGPAMLEIESQGEWSLKKGDAYYIKAGRKHRLINGGRKSIRQITVMESLTKPG